MKTTGNYALITKIIALVVVAIVFIPYIWGHLHSPEGMVYMGFADHPYDQNSYLSRVQQAKEGKFFIRRDFSLEHQRPLFFNPHTWTMGVLARFLHLTPLQIYYGGIAFYAFLLLYVINWFISLFIRDPRQRLFAFALCAFSSGLCWLIPAQQWELLFQKHNLVPIDYWIAETITFETIFSFPQFAATAALMLAVFGFFLKAIQPGDGERYAYSAQTTTTSPRTQKCGIAALPPVARNDRWKRVLLSSSLYGGLALFALSFVHPVDVVTVAVVIAAYLLAAFVISRKTFSRALSSSLIMASVAAPASLYMVYLFKTEPVFIEWSKEQFLSPHPLSYIIGYGIPLFLAVPELIRIARRPDSAGALLFFWVICVAALLYAPISFQRRLSTAVHVPICILAARTTFRLLLPRLRFMITGNAGKFPARRAEACILVTILLLTTPANIVKIARCIHSMKTSPLEFYLPEGDMNAMQWMMTNHNEDAAIISTRKSGLYLPAYTGNRVYVGHWSETIHFNEKAAKSEWLLYAPGDEEAKRRFLQEEGIDYLYYGNFERMKGPLALEGAPYLEKIYHAAGVIIYGVYNPD